MLKETRREQPKKSVVFENLDFKNLNDLWEDCKLKEDDEQYDTEVQSFSQKIALKGSELSFSGLKIEYIDKKSGKAEEDKANFVLSKNKPNLELTEEDGEQELRLSCEGPKIEFEIFLSRDINDKLIVETSILKSDKERELPPQTAGIIYRKIFDYIQSLADKKKEILTHRIEMFLEISDTPMLKEKWKKIFGPILEKHNYQPVSENEIIWKKEYNPK